MAVVFSRGFRGAFPDSLLGTGKKGGFGAIFAGGGKGKGGVVARAFPTL